MTHSLHRSGSIESQKRDFVWFMYQTKGVNDKDIKPKALQFIAAAEDAGSENWGDVKTGPKAKFSRQEIEERLSDKSRLRGVFTRKEQVVKFLKDIKAREVGQSVVITGVLPLVLEACREAEVTPHTINYALGIWGKKDNLPDETTLSISTMCGHHMISPKFVKQVMRQVGSGRVTPEEGANKLASFCYCGIFNPVRAADILREEATKTKQGKE